MPLTYTEMDAWARLTGNDPTAWEITVIKKLDREYLTEINKK